MIGEIGKMGATGAAESSRRQMLARIVHRVHQPPSRRSRYSLWQALDHGRSLTAPVRRCTLGAEADRQVEGGPISRTWSPPLFGAGSLSMNLREYN